MIQNSRRCVLETVEIAPAVVVLGSRYDITCDYVVSQLLSHSITYLRLNTEDLPQFAISVEPSNRVMQGQTEGFSFLVAPCHLRAVLFRRPIFLRESENVFRPPEIQLARIHWASFMRSFMMFEECRWMNHPAATYKAENKAVQLAVAESLGA